MNANTDPDPGLPYTLPGAFSGLGLPVGAATTVVANPMARMPGGTQQRLEGDVAKWFGVARLRVFA